MQAKIPITVSRDSNKEFTSKLAKQSGEGIADRLLLNEGFGQKVEPEVSLASVSCATNETNQGPLKVLGAGAEAHFLHAEARVSQSPVTAAAHARADVADASANAYLVEGVIEANASAAFLDANADASAGIITGVHAKAGACVAHAEAGLVHTPLNAHAEVLGAEAEAAISPEYTGIGFGAHLFEVSAGPFALRAGVKIGVGIRNGVPQVDLGPVTVPCSVM